MKHITPVRAPSPGIATLGYEKRVKTSVSTQVKSWLKKIFSK